LALGRYGGTEDPAHFGGDLYSLRSSVASLVSGLRVALAEPLRSVRMTEKGGRDGLFYIRDAQHAIALANVVA